MEMDTRVLTIVLTGMVKSTQLHVKSVTVAMTTVTASSMKGIHCKSSPTDQLLMKNAAKTVLKGFPAVVDGVRRHAPRLHLRRA